jgi:phage tail-like protein
VSTPAPEVPRAASARRYLRGNLPAVYRESADGRSLPVMGLLVGLEQLLDPVVAMLDNLTGHLQPATAPADMVDFLTELTGAPLDDTLAVPARRELVKAAASIGAARGTRAGLQLALTCAFPELEPQVRDNGQVRWGRDAARMHAARHGDDGQAPPGRADVAPGGIDVAPVSADVVPGMPSDGGDAGGSPVQAAFEVLVTHEPSPLQAAQIARCVADHLPVGATYRLGARDRGVGGG